MEDLVAFYWSVGAGAIGMIAFCALLKLILDRNCARHLDPASVEVEKAPQDARAAMTAEQRYVLWRAELGRWVDLDGTSEGLDALLERWRDVPHDKRKKQIELTISNKGVVGVQPKITFTAKKLRADIKLDEPLKPIEDYPDVGVGIVVAKFKPGDWVRFISGPGVLAFPGQLFKVEGLIFGAYSLIGFDSKPVAYESEMELAIPRAGEWWRISRQCAGPQYQGSEPHKILPNFNPCDLCTWEPVNFGHGEVRA